MAEDEETQAPAPAGAPFVIDLDRERAVRREGRGDAIEVHNKGQAWRLPVELPVDAVQPLAGLERLADIEGDVAGTNELDQVREALEGGLCVLFCDEDDPPLDEEDRTVWQVSRHAAGCGWRRWRATRPSLDDELALWAGLFAGYGTSLGEALASLDSSTDSGAPSGQTSNGGMASTHGKHGPASVPVEPGQRAAKRAAARKRPAKAKAAAAAGSPG